MSSTRAVALVAVIAAACRPLPQARRSVAEATSPAEEAAIARVAARRCDPVLGFLAPGLAQWCLRKDGEAALLLGLAAGEAGAAIAIGQETGFDHPAAVVPLIGLQDLWVYGVADGVIEQRRA